MSEIDELWDSRWIDRKEHLKLLDGKRGGYIRSLWYPIKPNPSFSDRKFLLGKEAFYGKDIFLPVGEAFRALFLGPTRRAGKTFACQRIVSMAAKAGWHVVVLTDLKNEFESMSKPIQQKFADKLPKHREEYPMSLPIKVYRPLFLMKNDGSNVYKQSPAQIQFSDCSFSDLTTLMNLDSNDEPTQRKRDLLMHVFEKIRYGEIDSFDQLEDEIMDVKMFSGAQKKALIKRLRPLQLSEVIGNKYPFSFAEDLAEGFVPVLNLAGFEDLGREFSSFPQAYVAVILRQLIRAKRKKQLKNKMLILLDEIARFCPRSKQTTSKKEILEANDLVAGLGINLLFCSQDISSIPTQIIRQSNFVFVSSASGLPMVNEVFKEKGLWEWSPSFYNETADEFKEMKKHEWLLINSQTRKKYNISFYPPLCGHKETTGK